MCQKIDLEYENGKQLQVTKIKITEITDSKEDNSIHRLDVSGSTGLGGAAGGCGKLPRLSEIMWLFSGQIVRYG